MIRIIDAPAKLEGDRALRPEARARTDARTNFFLESTVLDPSIEDLASLGQKRCICPRNSAFAEGAGSSVWPTLESAF